jgi:putative endonuclease
VHKIGIAMKFLGPGSAAHREDALHLVRDTASLVSCPARGAARSDATQSRDPHWQRKAVLPNWAVLNGIDPGLISMNGPFFVYVLASQRNGTLYVGVTNNLARRMLEHKNKLVSGFTKKYGVDLLVYFETFDSVLEARAREHSLKRWRRTWKIKLIEEANPDWSDLTHQLNG